MPPVSPGFEASLVQCLPRLRAFVRRRVSCPQTADDLVQETMLKALRSRHTLRKSDRLAAWLYRIARCALVDQVRRRRPTVELNPETFVVREEAVNTAAACVAKAAQCYLGTLPPEYRAAVQLAEAGHSLEDVARELGISLTAAKSRVRRGRLRIRAALEGCCELKFDARGRVTDYEVRARCGCGGG